MRSKSGHLPLWDFTSRSLKRHFCVGLLGFVCLTAHPAVTHAQGAPATKTTDDEVIALYKAMLQAIDADDSAGVIKVLTTGFPADFADSNGNTLLMMAAQKGKAKAAAALIAGEAKVDAISKNGATALMLASSGGFVDATQVLLASKADPNLRGKDRPTPLHLAAANGHVEVLKSLLKLKADINLKDSSGFTPLELAFIRRNKAALETLRPVYKENEPNFIVWTQQTLFVAAAEKKSAEVLKLLAFGFDPNGALDADGANTPLEVAINNDHVEGVKLLLFAGADPNRPLPKAEVPIWWLAMTVKDGRTPNLRMLPELIKAGAKIDAPNAKGIKALDYAKAQPNPEFAKILVAAGAK